jgi:poly-gamma-glutamate capsule biosynthesis protein CapA/YwtB (metallophosphatase superfamily)
MTLLRSLAPALCALALARTARADGPVTVLAAGDVALAWRVNTAMNARAHDPFRRVRPLFAAADLTFVNLECVLSDGPEMRWRTGRFPIIRGSPAGARAMASAGIDVASVANNHAFDLGARGALDTRRALRDAGIAPVGGGEGESPAEPVVREVRGVRVGFLAFTAQMNHEAGRGARVARLDARALDAVRALDARVDVVLVSLHWGTEFSVEPTPGQIALAHRLVDAGADAILGHHPHVLQSIERYRGRPIAYSLGNFVFGPQPSPRDLSALLELSLQRGPSPIVRAALRPIRLEGPLGSPTPVTGARATAVIARVRAASGRFHTALTERDGALVLEPSAAPTVDALAQGPTPREPLTDPRAAPP